MPATTDPRIARGFAQGMRNGVALSKQERIAIALVLDDQATALEGLRDLLCRIDAVTVWDGVPNASGLQEEIEAALGSAERSKP